jgi:hypothetical protein
VSTLVYVLADNNEVGAEHAGQVAENLAGVAALPLQRRLARGCGARPRSVGTRTAAGPSPCAVPCNLLQLVEATSLND